MLPTFFLADFEDPDEDPGLLFLASAQHGSIPGLEMAMSKNSDVFFFSDGIGDRMTALHVAAASCAPNAVAAVRWLLEKGMPWSASDGSGRLAEHWATMLNNKESATTLRNWAVEFEYELYYRSNREEDHPDHGKPLSGILRLDTDKRNKDFCKSFVWYLNPKGAPEDEVAFVIGREATGIMMEWERPIMRETARLLLDGMPTTGLRILNIGFGIGMIDTYFQDALPAEHVIIEGHPTCLGWMRHKGWYDRPGVRILEGRWQDFFPSELPEPGLNENQTSEICQKLIPIGRSPNEDYMVDIGKFDIVYFDTFQEGYRGHFAFIRNVPGLLRGPGSRFSYFNGHAAKRAVEYQIYMEVSRLHHNDLGMNTDFFPTYVDPKTIWYTLQDPDKGIEEDAPQHTIPICALAPTVPRRIVPNVGWKSNRYRCPAQDPQN